MIEPTMIEQAALEQVLRLVRREHIEALAHKAGITSATLYNWLNGVTKPSFGKLTAVIDALGCELVITGKRVQVRPIDPRPTPAAPAVPARPRMALWRLKA